MDVELRIWKNCNEGRLHMWVLSRAELVLLTPIVQRSAVKMCRETLSNRSGYTFKVIN